MVTIAVNPYLDRNFASIYKEITTDKLPLIGKLPLDLSGMFVQNIIFPYTPQRSQLHRLFYMICEFHKQHQTL